MAGHMGDKFRTMQNLEIIKSDPENNLMFIKGSIPGSKNSIVFIQKNSKKINKMTVIEKISAFKAEAAKTSTKKKEKPKEEKKAAPEKKEVKK